MTLTSELRTPSSAISRWAADRLPGTRAVMADLRAKIGPDPSALVPAARQPYPAGYEPGRQGLAHELRLHASLARPDLRRVAAMAVRGLPRQQVRPALEVVGLMQRLLDEARPWSKGEPWLLTPELEDRLARGLWVVAQVEAGWRRGMHDPSGPLLAMHASGEDLLRAASDGSVADLVALAHAASAGPVTALREVPQEQVVLSPGPTGGRDVGGADGDLLVGRLLVEVKTVSTLSRIGRQDLLQAALYVLLDYEDAWQVDRVGLYLGRHALLATWPAVDFFGMLAGSRASLAGLRADLRDCLRP